jgi:hypothetical protein
MKEMHETRGQVQSGSHERFRRIRHLNAAFLGKRHCAARHFLQVERVVQPGVEVIFTDT